MRTKTMSAAKHREIIEKLKELLDEIADEISECKKILRGENA
jgi:hypothetical protein